MHGIISLSTIVSVKKRKEGKSELSPGGRALSCTPAAAVLRYVFKNCK